VRAVLRRIKESATNPVVTQVSHGNLNINFAERRVTVDNSEVQLTPTEYNLLQELSLNKGKVFSHAMLLGRIWGPEYSDEREYLRVFIGRLRKKIESNPADPQHIVTIPGVGYQFRSRIN
jgi:two-component system KDP operon response regulator KdpE